MGYACKPMTFEQFRRLFEDIGAVCWERKEHIGDNVYTYLYARKERYEYKCDNVHMYWRRLR